MTTTPRRRFLEDVLRGAVAGPLLATVGPSCRAAPQTGVPDEDLEDLRQAYDLAPGVHYLNHASIGTMPRTVRQALEGYLAACESNPWLHMWGGAWDEAIAGVHQSAAVLLGCVTEEIALVRNTTEAFQLLAQGLPLGPGDEVLFSSLNHIGAGACWHHQARRRGFSVREFGFPIEDVPSLSAEDVVELHEQEIREQTRVLVLPHVDNIVGLRHPLTRLVERARARGVRWVAVDGAQSIGMFPVDVRAGGADFYATSAHKWLQAPKGTGILFARREVLPDVEPMFVTWGQARWKGTARALEDYGTRDLPQVLALGDALAFQGSLGAAEQARHFEALFGRCRERCAAEPRLTWRSPQSFELGASLYAVGIEGKPSDVFDRLWGEHGYVFRPFDQQGTVRISPNLANTADELDGLLDLLAAT